MKFNIPEPCSADWDKMKIGLNQRHCDSCQKNVIDFTQRSREEILTYLLMHNGERVCGHIRKSQLNFSFNEIMFVIDGMTKKEKKSNLPFYILCMGALLLASCNNGATTGKMASSHNTSDTIVQSDSHLVEQRKVVQDTVRADTVISPQKTTMGKVIPPPPAPVGIIMTGEVIEGDIDVQEEVIDGNMEMEIEEPKEEIFQFVEVMPEFPGGVDVLMKFLRDNVIYPAIAKDNNIQGTVIAAFVVTDSGSIEDIRIIEPVKGAPFFDQEVIRVIKKMPNWTPGMKQGEPVHVRFRLPVKFRLD
ncbi:MAG: TonB family protein [Bacteroidia bacterium]|jgi:TonB family protein